MTQKTQINERSERRKGKGPASLNWEIAPVAGCGFKTGVQ